MGSYPLSTKYAKEAVSDKEKEKKDESGAEKINIREHSGLPNRLMDFRLSICSKEGGRS